MVRWVAIFYVLPRCVKTYWAGGRLAVVVSALWFRGSGSHVESVNPGRDYFLGKDAFIKFGFLVTGRGLDLFGTSFAG